MAALTVEELYQSMKDQFEEESRTRLPIISSTDDDQYANAGEVHLSLSMDNNDRNYRIMECKGKDAYIRCMYVENGKALAGTWSGTDNFDHVTCPACKQTWEYIEYEINRDLNGKDK